MSADDVTDGLYGLHIGAVVSNADPLRLGRITVRIPGLIEPESEWALPLGTGGGKDRRGNFNVPEKDAEVGIFFKGGCVDAPYWIGANWGLIGTTPEVPLPVRTITPSDAAKVKAMESEHFLVVIDDRAATKGVYLQDKVTGDCVEIDGVKQGVRIKGTYAVMLESDGQVEISGLKVRINGREGLPGPRPI